MSDKVSVEMTKAQKEKVVDLLAKDEPKKLVEVSLKFEHEINNNKYGPGKTMIPEDLKGYFEVTEDKVIMGKIRENESNENLVEIIGRGITRRIK